MGQIETLCMTRWGCKWVLSPSRQYSTIFSSHVVHKSEAFNILASRQASHSCQWMASSLLQYPEWGWGRVTSCSCCLILLCVPPTPRCGTHQFHRWHHSGSGNKSHNTLATRWRLFSISRMMLCADIWDTFNLYDISLKPVSLAIGNLCTFSVSGTVGRPPTIRSS